MCANARYEDILPESFMSNKMCKFNVGLVCFSGDMAWRGEVEKNFNILFDRGVVLVYIIFVVSAGEDDEKVPIIGIEGDGKARPLWVYNCKGT